MKDLYFISEEARLIFGLCELNGKAQLDFLGTDVTYYTNKNKAKNWYKETKVKVENSEHPMKDVAIENLNKLYKGMK
ncbi:hypothetical protein LDJ90_02595 [Fusobacterium vincentii]|uniref:hypothetical protein n=1 Tax=Fusobacterium vincentii TaxID=155615 RepID=UPI000C1C4BE7|nr:hypothetical protein [Fusobacterium vincentii]ATV06040.1 hypothetical protein CS401_04175 [Fusobacterium vincentii]